ncbi:MAG: amino acid-binding protein [Lachnospiraceae bacterium]|jgi:ACT domain-containing protein|nr:amino acid-binding protein [Lachnospiraceae bacterium]MBR3636714.1 amino acid-binding protein [Lachnospiraceae bacterium]
MLKQLSIYAENKKGTMRNITEILSEENINIWGSVTNDSAEFGIIRMIVSDPDLAKEKLEKAGYYCKLCNVIGIEMADEVGALNRLLKTLYDSNINVDYIYLSFNRDSGLPVQILHADDTPEVEDCIRSKGFKVV